MPRLFRKNIDPIRSFFDNPSTSQDRMLRQNKLYDAIIITIIAGWTDMYYPHLLVSQAEL